MIGHDHGLIVFKLERERPPLALHQNLLYYVKGKNIRGLDLGTVSNNSMTTTGFKDVPLVALARGLPGQFPPPKAMSYNPADHSLLMTSVIFFYAFFSLLKIKTYCITCMDELKGRGRRNVCHSSPSQGFEFCGHASGL
jgi:coatomer protein complex subunit alpha (xenin)